MVSILFFGSASWRGSEYSELFGGGGHQCSSQTTIFSRNGARERAIVSGAGVITSAGRVPDDHGWVTRQFAPTPWLSQDELRHRVWPRNPPHTDRV